MYRGCLILLNQKQPKKFFVNDSDLSNLINIVNENEEYE